MTLFNIIFGTLSFIVVVLVIAKIRYENGYSKYSPQNMNDDINSEKEENGCKK